MTTSEKDFAAETINTRDTLTAVVWKCDKCDLLNDMDDKFCKRRPKTCIKEERSDSSTVYNKYLIPLGTDGLRKDQAALKVPSESWDRHRDDTQYYANRGLQ
ncbi:hypothetical protein B0T19DRAFT_400731 [Cercophora scortea]|uniref:RanBP2-type domain-containing protein n=1 Tax=Cercophora scortea TaxID=314031 RepID=A0AAE0IMU5_9PEZI|nr:hypothetical protein B0T19DRAFT_400731 [Cercophora scortea]